MKLSNMIWYACIIYQFSLLRDVHYIYCNEIAGYTAHMYQQFILIALKDKTKYV